MKTWKNLVLVLSTGYILVYFSEHLFWARVRPGDTVGGWLATWAAYSLLAYVFLGLVVYFRVNTIWALFLAGAAFGWLAEGVVVQTTYEMLPLSISFTGLSWHAMLSVGVGWYAIRKAIHATSLSAVIRLGVVTGAVLGLWAIFWWGEPDGGVSSIAEFALFSFVTTVLVIVAYVLLDWSTREPLILNRWTVRLVAAAFVLYFIFVSVPAAPLALFILPFLLALVYWGLRQNRLKETQSGLVSWPHQVAAPLRYISLLTIPLTAVLFYSLATVLQLQWRTGWVLYAVTTPLGFILFVYSLYQVLRKKPVKPAPTETS